MCMLQIQLIEGHFTLLVCWVELLCHSLLRTNSNADAKRRQWSPTFLYVSIFVMPVCRPTERCRLWPFNQTSNSHHLLAGWLPDARLHFCISFRFKRRYAHHSLTNFCIVAPFWRQKLTAHFLLPPNIWSRRHFFLFFIFFSAFTILWRRLLFFFLNFTNNLIKSFRNNQFHINQQQKQSTTATIHIKFHHQATFSATCWCRQQQQIVVVP